MSTPVVSTPSDLVGVPGLSWYDDFSIVPDGNLAGRTPQIGVNAWTQSGPGVPTRIESGAMVATGNGPIYALAQTGKPIRTLWQEFVLPKGQTAPAGPTMIVGTTWGTLGSITGVVHLNIDFTTITVSFGQAAAPAWADGVVVFKVSSPVADGVTANRVAIELDELANTISITTWDGTVSVVTAAMIPNIANYFGGTGFILEPSSDGTNRFGRITRCGATTISQASGITAPLLLVRDSDVARLAGGVKRHIQRCTWTPTSTAGWYSVIAATGSGLSGWVRLSWNGFGTVETTVKEDALFYFAEQSLVQVGGTITNAPTISKVRTCSNGGTIYFEVYSTGKLQPIEIEYEPLSENNRGNMRKGTGVQFPSGAASPTWQTVMSVRAGTQIANLSNNGLYILDANDNIIQTFGANNYRALSLPGNADYTLTQDQAKAGIWNLTGTLTTNMNLIFPLVQGKQVTIANNTTGAFTLTVKSSTGTGIAVTQGKTVRLYCDGTNWLRETTEV